MKITDLLDRRSIEVNGSASSKEDAINKMVDLMCQSGKINNKEEYKKKVFAREEEGSTGIGEGIAIPHAKCDAVSKPGLAAMVVRDGVEFDSLDGAPVSLIFLIAAPDTKENVHAFKIFFWLTHNYNIHTFPLLISTLPLYTSFAPT